MEKEMPKKQNSGCLTVIGICMGAVMIFMIFGSWLGGSGTGKRSQSQDIVASDNGREEKEENYGYTVKPEEMVIFKPGSFACLDKEKYKKAIEYAVKKEKTKFRGLFQNFDCIPLDEGAEFKVISVDGGYWGSYVEIITTDSDETNGLWAEGSTIGSIVR